MPTLSARVAACLFLILAITACGGGKEITKTEEKDVLKILRSDKFEILDPQASSSGGDIAILSQMYEGLVRAPEISGGPVSVPKWEKSLAIDWKSEDSAKLYTFTLRAGVKFHDGRGDSPIRPGQTCWCRRTWPSQPP